MPQAVIYARVSSEDQVKNLSLDTQEKTCRDYCERQGWSLLRVYREEGESARTADRPVLKELLEDLRRRPGSVDFVVVYDTSRFARDVYVHASLKQLIMACGARLRAATQPLDDSAAGRAIEGVFAVFNQLDNELRSEKTTAGMKESVLRGRWVWKAPLGYRTARIDGRKAIEPDASAALIKAAFHLVADGTPPAEALERLNRLGLRTKKGRHLTYSDLARVLTSPVYAGIVRCQKWGVEAEGQHKPLVTREVWYRVQAALKGRSTGALAERRPEHPDFPLRGFVRCAQCEKPLTAS